MSFWKSDLSDDKGEGFSGNDENEDSGQSNESLDSDVEAEEDDKEESEFYKEGEYGDLYDDEANESGDDDDCSIDDTCIKSSIPGQSAKSLCH
ncbi:hypothetical protein CROQUDRAFT_99098 [Cronartium quercuum f. sp. fusiforme G11]|uniref:Uncharacterized protein n=1 Tax=Cronartium quercuum f. sp. fusiforme G11 TaxID=708437 RepID=A0A9P6N8B1_9BASI|nr:hypothetical protein CROQUDRAFT_99098 [Cronartium quercuum f. sp. fusiforme G11]